MTNQNIVFLGVILALAGFAVHSVAADIARERDALTVQETLGLAFYRTRENPRDWHLYRRANRNAKRALIRLCADKANVEAYPTALRILGYIAEKDDIRPIVQKVTSGLKGRLSDRERDTITAMLDSLGIMASRGIKEATDQLREMANPAYWEATPYKVSWRELGEEMPLEHELRAASWAVQGLALSGGKDVAEIAGNIIGTARKPTERKALAWELGRGRLRTLYQRRLALEQKPVSDLERYELPKLYAAHKSAFPEPPGVGTDKAREAKGKLIRSPIPTAGGVRNATTESAQTPPLYKEDAAWLRKIVDEAQTSFKAIADGLFAGARPEEVARSLLDNGKPLDMKKIKRLRGEIEKEMGRQKDLLDALNKREIVQQDFVVRRVATYTFPKFGQKEIGAARKTEEITVTFSLVGSRAIVNGDPVLARLRGGSPTVARDGTLIVLMKKIDGKWYWNPFGW